jgi:hypothetical protein
MYFSHLFHPCYTSSRYSSSIIFSPCFSFLQIISSTFYIYRWRIKYQYAPDCCGTSQCSVWSHEVVCSRGFLDEFAHTFCLLRCQLSLGVYVHAKCDGQSWLTLRYSPSSCCFLSTFISSIMSATCSIFSSFFYFNFFLKGVLCIPITGWPDSDLDSIVLWGPEGEI